MTAPPPRLTRLQNALGQRGLDGAILFGAEAICHLSGYWRYLGGAGAVVAPLDGLPTLVLTRDEEPLVGPAPVAAVVGFGASGWAVERDPDGELAATLRDLMRGGRWGVGFGDLAPGVVGRLGDLTDVTAEALAVRQIKDADEVDRIAAATRLTRLGQQVVQEYLLGENPTEIGALSRAHAAMQEAAGEVVEVIADMIAGDHASGAYAPIAPPGARVIAPGEALIADLLVRHRGYWGQTTRTYGRGAIADPEAAEAAAAVRAVTTAGAAALRPGMTAGALDALLQADLATRVPGAHCPHHTGHGIGLSFADAPQIVPDEPAVLQEGMALTLNPGTYRAGHHGVRVADVYVVTATGGVPVVPES